MNYYQILKLQKDATQEEIRDSYISLVKKYHPDIYKGNKEYAEKITKELNDAYDVLSNPEQRAEYDLTLYQPTTDKTNSYYSDIHFSSHYKNYNYYKNTYQNINNSNIPNKQQTESWLKKIQNKSYNFIDKHTQNLNSNSKILLILLLIFLASVCTLFSIYDYLNFITF